MSVKPAEIYQSLAAHCFNKEARLETTGQDRNGRTIATVHCAGVDANAEQVRQGMAWVFDRYARPDSPLYGIQREAADARRGLWSDPQPVPPWEWRRRKRDTESENRRQTLHTYSEAWLRL